MPANTLCVTGSSSWSKLRVAVSGNLRVLVLIQFKFELTRYKNDTK